MVKIFQNSKQSDEVVPLAVYPAEGVRHRRSIQDRCK